MPRAQVFVVLLAIVFASGGSRKHVPTPHQRGVSDVVMDSVYVPPEEKRSCFWRNYAQEVLNAKLKETLNKNKAKNAILFIGDGMSVPTIMAARVYAGQLKGELGEGNTLAFERFPVTGLARTYCLDAQVPDSACTATAYLCGVKTNDGVIGLNGNVTRGSCYSQLYKQNWVSSIGQWALDKGLDVGIVTTTRVTHASPAGMYAHTADRDWESDADVPEECLRLGVRDIAYQLVTRDPGRRFKVIMGGGRREFTPNLTSIFANSTGTRLDGLDLIKLWREDKIKKGATNAYVADRNELMKVYNSGNLPEYLLGLFQDSHMDYHLEATNQPTLEEMVEVAIKILSRSSKGYFLFVEGGKIDLAHHENYAYLALDETVEYSKAVKKARTLTDEKDTLIVVTSDHAHTMSVVGYPSRGNDILGIVDTAKAEDGKPYTTLSYANGRAVSFDENGRVDVTLSSEFLNRSLDYEYPNLVPLEYETHGGDDVAVFASGPWQHLFTASYEQSVIPYLMSYAMCLEDRKHENCNKPNRGAIFKLKQKQN